MIGEMDRAIGQLLETLRATGQLDRTMIWFLSDNGAPPGNASRNEPLRGNKGTLREGGIRVPFLLRWKDGGVSAGRTVEDPVSALDIVPTSLAAAGIPAAEKGGLDGVDLLPFLRGTAAGTSRIVTIDSGVTLTNSGAIANGTTANALVKTGSGELVLSASNTYTGGVTINCAACGGRWRKCSGRRLADAGAGRFRLDPAGPFLGTGGYAGAGAGRTGLARSGSGG